MYHYHYLTNARTHLHMCTRTYMHDVHAFMHIHEHTCG